MALVGAVLTTVFGAQVLGATASNPVPVVEQKVVAQPTTDVAFVSSPVVQALPSKSTQPMAEKANSLAELVDQQTQPADLSDEMRCLAGAVYFESRGESLNGQLAVARVVINRSESGRFPRSYCGVVYQPSQFSFVRGHSMPKIREHSHAWREAVAIAKIATEQAWESPVKGALYFHATHVSPKWRLTRLARVDNHIFYV